MAASFFFYDLETTGFDARQGRIMQFAGQRTDLELKPVGEPVNVLIKLTPDVLPGPNAIMVTGITPQQTLADGLTEAEFLKLFYDEVVKPDTIFMGFNSIRFDDEFMRFLHYRNFYDAYEWQWKDGCSRWDLLDLVRMTRALRPDGIKWPFAPDGKPANRLEFLTKVNKLDHSQAHDALDDVRATIAVAQLIRAKQPELFDYLLGMRDKKKVGALVGGGQPFVYTTGRYSSEHLHTSVAVLLANHPQDGAVLVYDLRHDPTPFLAMSVDELVSAWRFTKDPDAVRLPVKTIKYNRAPAVAPLGVIKDGAVRERLGLDLDVISRHLKILKKHQAEFAAKILKAIARLDDEREKAQTSLVDNQLTVDSRLYEGFIGGPDKQTMRSARTAKPEDLAMLADNFQDERLKSLLPLYKARNYPNSLTAEERTAWDNFIHQQLLDGGTTSQLAKYFARLEELGKEKLSGQKKYLLEELKLYGESIIPLDEAG
ncbi:exodeoxyribonuclease I [Candidatus Saccharibacteria bacterium CG_4_10_14_0_2_um_filter_52_9]|nr:MAG: exodeoxyribonuclease I [Candidatus Saccharibacteria bacterium CG_4_10_14_0_2_um_filter_52_9]